jgi:hypothetical protein
LLFGVTCSGGSYPCGRLEEGVHSDGDESGEKVSRFFTNDGKMMPPIQRVNVDFAAPMLKELDAEARALNISRQAVIKSLLRQALDRQRLARRAR